jgi:hypothetical protein
MVLFSLAYSRSETNALRAAALALAQQKTRRGIPPGLPA